MIFTYILAYIIKPQFVEDPLKKKVSSIACADLVERDLFIFGKIDAQFQGIVFFCSGIFFGKFSGPCKDFFSVMGMLR